MKIKKIYIYVYEDKKKNHTWPMNLAFLEDRKYYNIQITHEERKIYSKKSPTFSLLPWLHLLRVKKKRLSKRVKGILNSTWNNLERKNPAWMPKWHSDNPQHWFQGKDLKVSGTRSRSHREAFYLEENQLHRERLSSLRLFSQSKWRIAKFPIKNKHRSPWVA